MMKLEKKFNLTREEWDKFVSANAADGGFLQSFDWGEFQKSYGRKIWRLALLDENKITATALVIKHSLPWGLSYLYVPRGPLVGMNYELRITNYELILNAIEELGKKEKAIFVRIEPPVRIASANPLLTSPLERGREREEWEKLSLRPVWQVQPRSTLILDLDKSEAELLAAMKSKTRYNIKVAQKHNIKIEVSAEPQKDLAEFMKLMQQTAQRDVIGIHPVSYYEKMLEQPEIKLVFARTAEGQAVVANIMAFFGKWCYYLHGASDYQAREKMAPYLLQWEMIKQAQSQGCEYYDFWGADPVKWPGVTRFKMGFAPELPLTEYAGAYDLTINPLLYSVYKIFKKA